MTRLLRRVAPLALLLLATTLAAASNGDWPPYDRALYPHWIKVEGTCRDVRAVVLIRDAEPGSVFFADPGECRVGTGVWRDPYAWTWAALMRCVFAHLARAGAPTPPGPAPPAPTAIT